MIMMHLVCTFIFLSFLSCFNLCSQALGSLPEPKRDYDLNIPDLEPEEEAAPALPEGFIGLCVAYVLQSSEL
jgi:hypothetical protein